MDNVFPVLERPFADGRLALRLSADASSFPLADFAQELVSERGAEIKDRLGAPGMDEAYWDIEVDGGLA